MMKTKILLLLALLYGTSVLAQDAITNLVVWAKDGSKTAYALKENPNVTFTSAEMLIKTSSVEVVYPMDNLQRFTYETSASLSVAVVGEDAVKPFHFDGESLIITASDLGGRLGVFSIDGKMVLEESIQPGHPAVVTLEYLSPGIYVVNFNNVSYKILKK